MKTNTLFSLIAAMSLALTSVAFAAGKTYQIKGTVTKVTDTAISVENGSNKWEVARDANTKVKGDLKVGSEVTITYMIHATAVDAKAGTGVTTTGSKLPVAAEPAEKPKVKLAAPSKEPDAQKKEEPQGGSTPVPTPTP